LKYTDSSGTKVILSVERAVVEGIDHRHIEGEQGRFFGVSRETIFQVHQVAADVFLDAVCGIQAGVSPGAVFELQGQLMGVQETPYGRCTRVG